MKPPPPPAPDMTQMFQTWLGFAGLLLVAFITGVFLLRSKDKENAPKGRELDQQLADQIRQDLQEERQALRDELTRERKERGEDDRRARRREAELSREIERLRVQLDAALRGQEAHEIAARERARFEAAASEGTASTFSTVPFTASLPGVPAADASTSSKGTDSL